MLKMKFFEAFILLLSFTNGLSDSTVDANKEVPNVESEEASDPSIVFSETINSATKLLYDLDVEVQLLVPADKDISVLASDEVGTTGTATTETQTSEPHIYSAISSEFELALSKQGESVGQLVTQLDTLQKRIQDTVTELTNRRRYILSAMLRPMLNSVRRIRSNVVRIQTQLTNIQSAASNVGSGLGGRPQAQTLGAADQTAIDGIRKRVDEIQKRIGDIIGRISSSLNIPGSVPSAVSQSQNSAAAGR